MSWLNDLASKLSASTSDNRAAIRPPGDIYGSGAIFLEGKYKLDDAFSPQGSLDIPLGIDNIPGSKSGIAWSPQALQGHALTFGATRSGKGVSAIIPALLTYQGSCLVIDPKGENAWVTAERRRQIGNRVVILDPWGEVNRRYAGGKQVEAVTRFNPLSALRADDPDFADDVGAIADALIVSTGDTDSHWTNSARELVAGLIAAEVERKPVGQASLGAVRRLLTATDEELAEEITKMREANPDSLAGRKLNRFTTATTEISGIRSTALTQTAILDAGRLIEAMETDDPPFRHGRARHWPGHCLPGAASRPAANAWPLAPHDYHAGHSRHHPPARTPERAVPVPAGRVRHHLARLWPRHDRTSLWPSGWPGRANLGVLPGH